jgi:hypothetical protein
MNNRPGKPKQAAISANYSTERIGPELFDNADWEKALVVRIDKYWSGDVAPDYRQAEARIHWSDQSLSVRFVCRQTEPLIVNPNPQVDQKTVRLWDKDVCEIFIAPDPNRPERYYEFEAAPTGEWLDLGIQVTPVGRETDWEFHSGMSVETKIGRNQITVVIRIPWSVSLPKPERGDAWRVNLFRCVGTGNERYLAWQPTYTPEPYFHVPEVFGQLDFV